MTIEEYLTEDSEDRNIKMRWPKLTEREVKDIDQLFSLI